VEDDCDLWALDWARTRAAMSLINMMRSWTRGLDSLRLNLNEMGDVKKAPNSPDSDLGWRQYQCAQADFSDMCKKKKQGHHVE
jgi:hypothetical protein